MGNVMEFDAGGTDANGFGDVDTSDGLCAAATTQAIK